MAIYQEQHGTRSRAVSQKLAAVLNAAAAAAGVDVHVFSGGQAAKGTKGARTGSTRHDLGNAADLSLSVNGRKLREDNPADLRIIQAFVKSAVENGATGIGAGAGYMGVGNLHVGFGRSELPNAGLTLWGPGETTKTAPAWLKQAASGVVRRPPPPPADIPYPPAEPSALALTGAPPQTPAQQAAAAQAAGRPPPTLRKGASDRSTGGAVSRLQQQLIDAGFNPGPVDGSYGPQTEKAVRAFERSAGLQVERPGRGAAGPEVLGRLPATAATRAATTARAIAGGASAFDPNTPAARPMDVVSARTLPWNVAAGGRTGMKGSPELAGQTGSQLQSTFPARPERTDWRIGPQAMPSGPAAVPTSSIGPDPNTFALDRRSQERQGAALNLREAARAALVAPGGAAPFNVGAGIMPGADNRYVTADPGLRSPTGGWTQAPLQDITSIYALNSRIDPEMGSQLDATGQAQRAALPGALQRAAAAKAASLPDPTTGAGRPGYPAPNVPRDISINDMIAGVQNIPSTLVGGALSASDWLQAKLFGGGGAPSVTATPHVDLMKSVPPAVPASASDYSGYVPGGYDSGRQNYGIPARPGQQSYYTPPSGGLGGLAHTASLDANYVPSTPALGGPLGGMLGGGPRTPWQGMNIPRFEGAGASQQSGAATSFPQHTLPDRFYSPDYVGTPMLRPSMFSPGTRAIGHEMSASWPREASLTPVVHVPSGDGIGRPYSKSNFASRFDTPVGALPGAKIATGAAPLTEHGAGYTVFDPQAADTTGVKWETLASSAFDPAAVSPPVHKVDKVVSSLGQAPAAAKLQVAAQVLKAISTGVPVAGVAAAPWTSPSAAPAYGGKYGYGDAGNRGGVYSTKGYGAWSPSGYTPGGTAYNKNVGTTVDQYGNKVTVGTYADSKGNTHTYTY